MSAHKHLHISVVVIGRNEGERLGACLHSVRRADWTGLSHDVWYVDSCSTDASVKIATEAGAHVLVLQDASPCAAKARNLGWKAAPGELILFLDGDTQLASGFVLQAVAAFQDQRLCAVWGHLRESDPRQSVYTAVLDLDWIYPPGRSLFFGGDVLVRRCAMAQVDGFDPSLNAGEEPEMCARLRAKGWEIEHLDVPMARHDLAVRTLRAYWLRCYRSGIAYAEVARRMQIMGDALWQKESSRDFWHGVLCAVYPPLVLAALALQPTIGMALVAAAVAALARTAWRSRAKAPGQWLLCLQYALHSHLQKLPALAGQLAWKKAHARAHQLALVEYKQ